MPQFPLRWQFALLFVAVLGCDAAKEQTAQALLQPPAGKKSIHAPQEWTLSDQSKLSGHLEAVETDEASYATLVVQHPAEPTPLKSLEFAFIDLQGEQTPGWESMMALRSVEAGTETFRQPFSAPNGTQAVLRVQAGDQPETLSPWKLKIGGDE
jgi:hypothetical protein